MDTYKKPATYLDEDCLRVPGQQFVLLSFARSTTDPEASAFGLKVRGVFETREAAEEHTKRLIDLDPTFDIYVADMYRWLLAPPKPDDIENAVYKDQYLNELITGHKEAQIRAKEFFEARVREEVAAASSVPEDIKEGLEAANIPPPKKMSWADEVEEERGT